MNIKLLLLKLSLPLLLMEVLEVGAQNDPYTPVEPTAVENTPVENTAADTPSTPSTPEVPENVAGATGDTGVPGDTGVTADTSDNNNTTKMGARTSAGISGEEEEQALEETLDTVVETNRTMDECGTTSSQLGMFTFYRPISKSILVIRSNFTVIWYYNNILDEEYSYPSQYITLSLFYEEDADPNSWASSWKKPVWVKEIPMGEIEQGPILTGNVPSYQWNWRIMSDEKGAVNTEGFQRNLQTNQKYRLRISGDGKDLQRNPDLECYQEGDIMPGVTRSFYVVDNVELPTYEPLAIPDGAPSVWTFKGWTSFLSLFTTTLLILFYLLI